MPPAPSGVKPRPGNRAQEGDALAAVFYYLLRRNHGKRRRQSLKQGNHTVSKTFYGSWVRKDTDMFDQITLPNGLRVVGERLTHVRSCTVGCWVKVGSMNERPNENGLSHFIEHMVFKGTAKRSAREIAEEMDDVGGQLNAFTSKDCT